MKDKLQHQIFLIEKKIDDLLPKVQPIGLINGKCGIAIFYLYLWIYTKEETHKHKAIRVLEQAIEDINQDKINFSFATGLSGIAWTVEHFKRNGLIDSNASDVLGDLENACLRVSFNLLGHENFDYLHGGLGFGIYCLEKPYSKEQRNILSQIAQTIIDKSCVTNNGRTWEAKFNKSKADSIEFNLGASHGIPSIIYFLIKVQPLITDEKIIDESIAWLKSVFYKENSISKIPERIIDGLKSPETSKLAWCYGDLGVSTSLLYAKSHQKIDTDFLEVALNTLKRVNHENLASMEIGLCHGVSGLAYMYNKLYHLSHISDFKAAADMCFNVLLEKRNDDNKDTSLLDGISGVGLSCLSALSHENTSWDKILLLS